MALDIPIVEHIELRDRSNLSTMMLCESCKRFNGVFVSCQVANVIGFNTKGERYDKVVWEKWHCLNCGNHWDKNYGVRHGR